MKQLTSYNRVAGYLNKLFDLLNEHYFENALSRPTITIQSTPKAYGHFTLRDDTWVSAAGNTHEINLGAGTLARPIEEVAATLLHEMVHFYCYLNHNQGHLPEQHLPQPEIQADCRDTRPDRGASPQVWLDTHLPF